LEKVFKNNNSICVIGNGPSLNEVFDKYSWFIDCKDIMCVNNFAFSENYQKLKPKYYLLLDPGYFVDSASERCVVHRDNLHKQLNKNTSWEMYLLLPLSCKNTKCILNKIDNNNIKIIYFNATRICGFKKIAHYLFKHNWGMPRAQNVLVAAIFVSINIGYEYIYLLGADHSWVKNIGVDGHNFVVSVREHFYDNKTEVSQRFEKPDRRGEFFTMYELLKAFSLMFKGYMELRDYAVSRGVNIYNATKNSNIDAFERIEINDDYKRK
jgi:hypothetical protein